MCQHDSPSGYQERRNAPRAIGLVRASTLFAVSLELIPVELGITLHLAEMGDVLLVLVVKLTCLTLILLQLVIYVVMNGVSALKYVKGRVAAIAVIVAISLAYTISMLSRNNLLGGG